MELNKIIQIGIITDSTERTNEILEGCIGWKHWGIWETTVGPGRYYFDVEEDFVCRMSFYSFGNIEVEVIEPLRGRSCWKDYLDRTGGGIHHLLFNVDSAQGIRKYFQDNGWITRQQGMARPYGENVIWAYADTDQDLDFTIEYTNRDEYPQPNVQVRPTVEGLFKRLVGVRILTNRKEAVSHSYATRLGWKPELDSKYRYKFNSIDVFLTQPGDADAAYREWLNKRGSGAASLVIEVENMETARYYIESKGKARLVGLDSDADFVQKAIYDIGVGCMIELVR